jgi:hypothetical protein
MNDSNDPRLERSAGQQSSMTDDVGECSGATADEDQADLRLFAQREAEQPISYEALLAELEVDPSS